MRYLLTGATGFVGVNLLRELVRRDDAEIDVLVRRSSRDKVRHLVQRVERGPARS